ncbi:hypothetical protein PGT21_036965 [Puccinia graminis f. sp. tritici]|uniref:Uncharacterized protein n=1 Tax=Puccinia graminis f. sp. tritici TaxID=56615 RepID=A0A5B0QDF1_PUCGR|nr:hypothetical protein PGT21_036965 [Puccinia graminis f. sp. tritici]
MRNSKEAHLKLNNLTTRYAPCRGPILANHVSRFTWEDAGNRSRSWNRVAGLKSRPAPADWMRVVRGVPDRHGARGTKHQRIRALDCGRSFFSTSRNPTQNSNPERSRNPLGPSQGASQLIQHPQQLYANNEVTQTSSAAQLRTARSKIKICM